MELFCLLFSGEYMAAVDVQGLAGDLTGLLGSQEDRRVGDFFRG